jgi:hypothetical protein
LTLKAFSNFQAQKRANDSLLNVVCLFVLIALWALFHYRVLFLGHAFVMQDASWFFYPLWKWGAEVWKQGWIPLWNPDAAFGTPFLADPEMGAWYPPLRFFYFFFPPIPAFNLVILFHHLSALLGFWVFAKNRGFSPPAALAGALAFGFPISAVCFTWDPAMLLSFSWMPWVFWASDNLLKGRRGALLGFSFCLAMQLASGYPVFCYLTLIALGLEWLAKAVKEKAYAKPNRPYWMKRSALGVFAMGLAGGFNLAWGLPFLEFKDLSNLGRRLEMPQSLPLESLATWLNPFFGGHPLHHFTPIPYWLSSFYMGIPVLAALLWGLGKGKFQRFSWALFFIWVILAMGSTLVMGDWARRLVPFYAWVARSGYLLVLVFFAGAILAMESFARLVEDKTKGGVDWGWLSLTTALFLFAFMFDTPLDLWPAWGAMLFCLIAAFKGYIPTPARWSCLLFSIVLSLGPADKSVNLTTPLGYYENNPRILGKMPLPGRIYLSPQAADSYGAISGPSVGAAYENLKQDLVPNYPLAYGREEVSYMNPLFLNSFLRWYLWTGQSPSEGVMNYLNVSYFVGSDPFLAWKPPPEEEGKVYVRENKKPLPKWFSVRNTLPEKSWEEAKLTIQGPDFDFSKISYLRDFGKPLQWSGRPVKEISRTPNDVELQVEGEGPALLASSETAYPGWQIKIGQETRPPETVNFDFRGVILKAGEKQATVVYNPMTFRFGCFISLLVCGIWVGMVFKLGLLRR